MELLHQSKYFKISQCDLKRCFCFETAHKSVHLSFCQLLCLRNKVRKIDLEAHFDNRNTSGLEILSFCNREHLIILNTYEVIDLKVFIESSFTLLQGSQAISALV